MKLSALPKYVYSMLGRIPVSFLSAEYVASNPDTCGRYEMASRVIEIAPDLSLPTQWATLWHEIIHVALIDAGARTNVLSNKQEEVVCDAIGTHLTAMMVDGSLKLVSPESRKAAMK